MFLKRALAVAATALVGALVLSGCTINILGGGSTSGSGMMGGAGMMGNSESGELSGADIMFAQMMIPHHQQAVDMGTLAQTRASDPKVKALAAQIKAEQAPEIAQMKKWLQQAGAPMEMGHDMGMNGMLSAAELDNLRGATGTEFDNLYLESMIAHHKGAIQMAEMVAKSRNQGVRDLAAAIIESQTKQISYMETLLAR